MIKTTAEIERLKEELENGNVDAMAPLMDEIGEDHPHHEELREMAGLCCFYKNPAVALMATGIFLALFSDTEGKIKRRS